jgi:hypothetical protein
VTTTWTTRKKSWPTSHGTNAITTHKAHSSIAHLRDVLGDQTYEALARKDEVMTTAAMAVYAYDQIDQARTELEAVSK